MYTNSELFRKGGYRPAAKGRAEPAGVAAAGMACGGTCLSGRDGGYTGVPGYPVVKLAQVAS
ncbi:hypothetical protein BGC31_13875 [Komagataeibacter xylinus]|nr:hypothetical protein H845_1393 [Komagataeibacter xylinus E25]RFP00698.1 hypothetical protein BGC31_13875 [Komagataeibacter xylinus]RFP07619.1 hypothetical protein BFX83_14165 [Komagataeibacter xylinus]